MKSVWFFFVRKQRATCKKKINLVSISRTEWNLRKKHIKTSGMLLCHSVTAAAAAAISVPVVAVDQFIFFSTPSNGYAIKCLPNPRRGEKMHFPFSGILLKSNEIFFPTSKTSKEIVILCKLLCDIYALFNKPQKPKPTIRNSNDNFTHEHSVCSTKYRSRWKMK